MALFGGMLNVLSDRVNMLLAKVPFRDTHSFSPLFLDYIGQADSVRSFYHRWPDIKSFSEQIAEKAKRFPAEKRKTLVATLERQYRHLPSSKALPQIQRLNDPNTFTVVTGHQLNICTGPLYFIYKIVTVINSCEKLRKQYPDKHFVPVYWMASEDHDYDEIKSCRVFGKNYVWETDQQGAVGRFSTAGLSELMDQIPGSGLFKQAYAKNVTLSNAVRQYVDELFGDYGLVVIDGDDATLKAFFKPVIEDDVINHTAKKIVDKTSKQLETLGYKTQVYCREINFFYLEQNLRSRIEQNGDSYEVLDTNLTFSADHLRKYIDSNPEKFSPNVILRPLYQEIILPNLAYCGGPAEIVYWLQLKEVFDHYQVPFPVLMPRNFGLILEAHVGKKFDKTGLSLEHLFLGKHDLSKSWILKNSDHQLSVEEERAILEEAFRQLKQRAERIDPTLGPFTAAMEKRTTNGIDRLEKKMLRAEKRRHDDRLNQISSIKDSLFPGEAPQERVVNVLNFFPADPDFIRHLITMLDPFDFQFNVIRYSEGDSSKH